MQNFAVYLKTVKVLVRRLLAWSIDASSGYMLLFSAMFPSYLLRLFFGTASGIPEADSNKSRTTPEEAISYSLSRPMTIEDIL